MLNSERRIAVRINELENAFRAAIAKDPALKVDRSGGLAVQLPGEFEVAVKTLAARSPERSEERSILHTVSQMWT